MKSIYNKFLINYYDFLIEQDYSKYEAILKPPPISKIILKIIKKVK